ncbi:MAG: hypothetical protein J6Q15_01680 [Clostridia bacterium]|nr:hypothetical protein [Clostridia bacterium]
MIAIIKNKDKTSYVTTILAVKYNYGDSQVIAFDKTFTKIIRLDMYRPYRTVYMLQEDNLEFATNEWQGLDWIINDNELLLKLENSSVLVQDYPKSLEYAYKLELPEWFEIKNEIDAKNLINISAGFHDGEPVKATIDGKYMELVLDKSFGCKFTLKFVDILESDIVGNVGIIYDSEMSVIEDIICWKITGCNSGWIDNIDWDSCPKTDPYIKCKKLLWKMEPSDN